MNNIAGLFFQAAAAHPERIAIVHGERSITYAELAGQVRATAGHFERKGLRKGDRVLVFVPMSIDLYRIVLALFSMGAGAVFLDAWVSRKRMELCCELADCRGFIGILKARLYAWSSRPLRRIPIRLGTALPSGSGRDPVTVEPDDTALITFTTGSTGTPKAARRSHGFLAAQFEALLEEIGPTPGDVDMTTLPIVLFINLGIGCTTVIPDFKPSKPASFRADRVAEQVRRHKVDRSTASPIHVRSLADHLLATGTSLPGLKKIFTGGAPVFPRDAEAMCRAFPDARVNVVFGSTECEPISSIPADRLVAEHREVTTGLCVGSIFHRTTVRIIGIVDAPVPVLSAAELDQRTVPEGVIGEIIVSGEHVLRSYFNNDEAFRRNKISVDGTVWHRTGDSGYVDERGLLFLTGRCVQLIQRGGGLFAPFVWEDRLLRVDGVARGTLLERAGQLTAVIETFSSVDRERLRADLLAAHPEIGTVVYVDRMPMDPRHGGKIDHEALAALMRSAPA